MSWSEASTCQKNEQTAEANIECPVARLLSPVSGYPMADARIPESPLILYPAGQSPVSGIWYRYQLPPLGVKLHYGQSKYKWEIEYIFVHSIYRFIRRQTKIADSFEPAFCRVRAYTKRLLKLAKHLPKFSSFFFAIGFFIHSLSMHELNAIFAKLLTAVELGRLWKGGVVGGLLGKNDRKGFKLFNLVPKTTFRCFDSVVWNKMVLNGKKIALSVA